MNTLALLGGEPLRKTLFPAYSVIGKEEIDAVRAVMESGILSRYVGAWNEGFYGGPQVRAFEDEWAGAFAARHAVAV
ncbi:MAG: DegT/DnrJ/EryC1/StrS family aminotransferase, partial [Alphaproteobacteria bacterium]|nr:DegT/DnrJ/EryC1/StrS family aminotransferase [Alphaproteobacteria bacterium]